MPIGELCNREVVFAEKKNTLLEAAQLMRHHHVGELVVVEARNGNRVPIGVVTDRDIVVEVVAQGLNVRDLTVGDIMALDLISTNEQTGVFEAIQLMRAKGIRRLPVVNDAGSLVGIIALDDILELLAQEMTELSRIMPRERSIESRARP